MTLEQSLVRMHTIYTEDPEKAVRGQAFINVLHDYLSGELSSRFSVEAKRAGVSVKSEAQIFGSHKPKNVDISVLHPSNGPLVMIGVRSQMSSIGKNALNYYEGIIGECISLQDRFPMATTGYVYLHPSKSLKPGHEAEIIQHQRYARMYAAITGRTGVIYKDVRGVYDEFAYMIVDFELSPPALCNEIVEAAIGPDVDLSIGTFVDRIVSTHNARNLFFNLFD